MSQPQMSKLSSLPYNDVLTRCELPAEAAAHLTGTDDVTGAISALVKNGLLVEAARMYAHALPKREAVWWACMCALHTAVEPVAEPDRKARELAEQWVRQQTDELRREAMEQAKIAGFQSPEAWAGVAAFWSGDSLAPPDAQTKVAPPPHLTGVAVVGAVTLASVRNKPALKDARLERFLSSARDIAAGGSGRLAPEGA